MSGTPALREEEREFFSLLARIIFSNPFSTERAQVEAILGRYATAEASFSGHHYGAVMPALEEHLRALEARGIDQVRGMQGEDRRLLEYAYLFLCYDRHIDDFDGLIREQIAADEQPAAAPFAAAVTEELRDRGFPVPEVHRYIALFYQLRRAYYFIDEALVGDSPSMKQLRHALWNSCFTADVRVYWDCLWDRMEDFTTLLLGETGTGKGSAAAAIGRSGMIPFDPRSERFRESFTSNFIATNLSQFPESLIESELFGHRKGAFTGAVDHHRGLFERCSRHGALFLDEIGDLSVPVQIKLLNVLQERLFSPVGSHDGRRFQGRVIAATNREVDALRRDGSFRDDFFYRLSSNVITVPPLRERIRENPAELELLTGSLLQRMVGDGGPHLLDRVMEALGRLPKDYAWPGNVRELEQAVRRVILNGEYHPDSAPLSAEQDPWVKAVAAGELNAAELMGGYCLRQHQRLGTYEAVAQALELDRRTVRRHVQNAQEQD